MKPTTFILILLLALSSLVKAQESKNDSLKMIIDTSTDNVELYQAYYLLAQKNYRNLPDESLEYVKKAKEYAIKIDSTMALAAAQQLQGVMFKNLGKSDSAIVQYLAALKVYEEENSLFGIASTSNDLGVLFKVNNDFHQALIYYKKANKVITEIDHKVGITMTLNNIGTIKNALGELDSAEFYYLKALETAEENNIVNGMALSYNNLGELFSKKGEHNKALPYYLKTLDFDRKSSDKIGMTFTYINLSQTQNALGNKRRAIQYIDSAIEQSSKLNAIAPLSSSFSIKSNLLEDIGDFKSALKLHREHSKLNDSIFNENKSKQIAELQTQYETEQKEQQIALQDAQIAEQTAQLDRNRILIISSILALILVVSLALLQRSRLKKKQQLRLQEVQLKTKEAEINATISSQEKERARYARDLHDGFGQMISVLNMNLQNLEKDPKPDDRQKVFDDSSKLIDEMYEELKNICFDLMPQTLIKNGLESALSEFVERVNAAGQVFIELNVFGLEKRLSEIQEISLYRISQEWINNILKYSDAQKVTLQITRDQDELTLLVEDDGTGFSKDLLVNGKGNGWKNLNTRTNLIQGELELETAPNQKGTTLIINAPAHVEKLEQNTVEAV